MKKFLTLAFLSLMFSICLVSCKKTVEVTINYNTNGGSPIETQKFTNSENFKAPSNPIKEHYVFKGWFENDELSKEFKWVFPEKSATYTIYAKWELVDTLLKYDLDGGTGFTNLEQKAKYGDKVFEILTNNIPTKIGYTFVGWLDQDNNLLTANSTVTMPEKEYTVKASWSLNNYNLLLSLNGGTLSQTSIEVEYDSNLYEKLLSFVPTREHYTFVGWQDVDGNLITENSNIKMPATDYTVTAVWALNTHVLTFDPNEGVAGSMVNKTVSYGQILYDILPTEASELPTRDGYNFAGWYTIDGQKITQTSEHTMPDENLTLVARWTKITYQITFDPNGGTFVNFDGEAVIIFDENILSFISNNKDDLVVNHDENIFHKWVYADGTEIGEEDTAHNNIELKAVWIYQSKITLNINGTTKEVKAYENEELYDVMQEVELPTLENYLFTGWSFEENGSIIKDDSTLVGLDGKVLFAIFEKDPTCWIRISFIAYNYSNVIECPKSSPFELPELTIDDGVTFGGWHYLPAVFTQTSAQKVSDEILNKGFITDTILVANCYTGNIEDYKFSSNNLVEYLGNNTDIILPSVNTAKNALVLKLGNGTVNPYVTEFTGTTNVSLFKDNTNINSVTFPVLCTEVFFESFAGCTSLTNVKIFDYTPVNFGAYAFSGCTSLESIDLASSYAVSIGMFEGCTNLATIDLGENMAVLYPYAFKGCTKLTLDIPRSVRTMYTTTFDSVDDYNVVLNANEKYVNGGIYSEDGKILLNWLLYKGDTTTGLTDDTKETIEIAAGTETIGSEAFSPIKAVKGGSGSTIIYAYANIARIILPSSVKEIEDGAFANYSNFNLKGSLVQNAVIVLNEGLEKIGASAFDASTSIIELNIPSTVKLIGEYAFRSTRNLSNITFADNLQLESIGEYAFDSANGTFGNITVNKLTYLGEGAFKYVDIAEFNAAILKEAGKEAFASSGLVKAYIPQLTVISEGLFSGCSDLTQYGTTPLTVDLNGVTTIETKGFNLSSAKNSITTVVNTESLTTLGDSALYLASVVTFGKVENVIDLSGITILGSNALSGFAKATKVKFAPNLTELPVSTLSKMSSLDTVGDVDGLVDLSQFTIIGNNALQGCENIVKVKLNAMVTFGTNIFQNCTALTTITTNNLTENLVDLSSFTQLTNNFLDGCTSVVNVKLNKNVKFGTNTFKGCSNLTTVGTDTINNDVVDLRGIKEFGNYTFNKCTSITKVILDSELTTIPNYMFDGCEKLTTVGTTLEVADQMFILPSAVKTIGTYAFRDCALSGNIVLHEGLEQIGNYAFANSSSKATICNKIESIVIPSSITKMGTYVFAYEKSLKTVVYNSNAKIDANTFNNCTTLESVTLTSTSKVTLGNKNAFTNVPTTCKIYVPIELVSIYSEDTVWKTIVCAENIQAIAIHE